MDEKQKLSMTGKTEKIVSAGLALLGLLVVMAFSGVFGEFLGDELSDAVTGSSPATIEEALKEAEGSVNSQAPIMVDEVTRLDKAAVDEKTISYHYSFVGYSKADINPIAIQTTLKESVNSSICLAPQMEAFRRFGVDMEYIYFDDSGEYVSSFVINAGGCSSQ